MSNIKQPIFSVVIPVYNVERFINQCLDSVLAQSFRSFEIICVNDGSTDKSVDLIEEYNDPRLLIIHQHNKGLAAARNTGINHSKGMFVALLDSDDFWHPEKLATHFRHLQMNPDIDISYSASRFVDESGNDMKIGQHPKLTNICPAHIFCRNPVGNGSAAVMRQSFLKRIGRMNQSSDSYKLEYFDEQLRQSEDIEFWLRSALDTNAKFEGVASELTYYRVNASGLSANLHKQFDFWHTGINKNREKHAQFFTQWYPLAASYQQRYLARRAIQSGESVEALRWMHRALKSDVGIVFQEPGKTLITYAAAVVSLLPSSVYMPLQKIAMSTLYSRT